MAGHRDRFAEAVAGENVSCRHTHPPVYSIPWLAAYAAARESPCVPASFPVTERVLCRAVEVESGPNLDEEDMVVSAEAVKKSWIAYRSS